MAIFKHKIGSSFQFLLWIVSHRTRYLRTHLNTKQPYYLILFHQLQVIFLGDTWYFTPSSPVTSLVSKHIRQIIIHWYSLSSTASSNHSMHQSYPIILLKSLSKPSFFSENISNYVLPSKCVYYTHNSQAFIWSFTHLFFPHSKNHQGMNVTEVSMRHIYSLSIWYVVIFYQPLYYSSNLP